MTSDKSPYHSQPQNRLVTGRLVGKPQTENSGRNAPMCPTIGDSPGPVPESQVQTITVKVCEVVSYEILGLKRVCQIPHTILCPFTCLTFLGSRNALLGHFHLALDDGLPASRSQQPSGRGIIHACVSHQQA